MAELPQYPAEDLNRGAQLLEQLGSFWATIFDDRTVLQTHLRSSANEQAQSHLDFLEAVASVSRFTVPVFHREIWTLMTIKRSDVESVPSVYKADDLVYGQQPGTVQGRPEGFVQTYGGRDRPDMVQARMPDNLAKASFTLQNYVVNPSRVMAYGVDYDVDFDRRLIRFLKDPFEDPMVPRRDIYDAAGNPIDTEIALWVYQGDVDLDLVYIQFGYALGIKLASSDGYKDLLNAFWNQHVTGPNVADMQSYLAALAGAPLVRNPVETVEVIKNEADTKLIVTNLAVYRAPLTANVLVNVGDTVYAGDILTDAVQIQELSHHAPDYSGLAAVTLSPNFLSGGYFGELTFHNRRVDVEYLGQDAHNRTVIRFEVTGFPSDVEKFWEDVQNRGTQPGHKTLAELLDTRENPVGQPGPLNLPVQINSLEFLLDNLMKNNLFIIKVRQASFGSGALGTGLFRYLREIIPPHTTYVVFIELTAVEDTVDLGQEGGEDAPGVQEAAGVFHGANPIAEDLFEAAEAPFGTASYQDAAVSVRLVSATCQ